MDVQIQLSSEDANFQNEELDKVIQKVELPVVLKQNKIDSFMELSNTKTSHSSAVKDTFDNFLSRKQSEVTEEDLDMFVQKSERNQHQYIGLQI